MTARICGVLLAELALSGCTTSTLTGDAGTPDVVTDTAMDTPADTATDPDGPADVMPPPCTEPGEVVASFTVDGVEWPLDFVHLDTPCTVTAIASEEVGHSVIDLLCGTGAMMVDHVVDLYLTPASWLSFWEGSEVWFEYISDPVWWVNRWFAIRSMGGDLLIGGLDTSWLQPDSGDPGFFSPVTVEAVGGLCAPGPPDWCGAQERQALDVTFDGSTGRIYDSTYGYVGGVASVEVLVEQATSYVDMDCDDVPDSFYSALFVMIPEG